MLNRSIRNNDTINVTICPAIRVNPAAPTHYDGDRGFKYLEGFPNCGNANAHHYILFALKHLLRLGKKDDIRVELKKAITYLVRAYYCIDPNSFNPEDISESFENWD